MSWTPSDEVRARDRERKRRAYVPKSNRGIQQRRTEALLDEAVVLLRTCRAIIDNVEQAPSTAAAIRAFLGKVTP